MENAFQAEDLIGERAQRRDGPFERQHLEAQVRIEVHVHRRQYVCVVGVAGLDEPVGEFALVVVVNQRQRADVVPLLIRRMILDEPARVQ